MESGTSGIHSPHAMTSAETPITLWMATSTLGGLGTVPKNAGVDAGKGNFAPRFGRTYRIGDKTVVRAGYGITVNPRQLPQHARSLSGSNLAVIHR